MRILIDECVPRKLKNHFPGHYCQTVQKTGLAGKKNGQLLTIADQMAGIRKADVRT
jgi:predicted nuclease of predicted toxin-antitoxin system